MIRDLIWDLDGTLFDTYPAISAAFQAALRRLGADAPTEEIMPLARVSFGHCAEQLSARTGLPAGEILETFFELYADIPPDTSPPFPSAREVCTWAVVTGGHNVIVTHRGHSSTEALLDAHGLRSLFAGWITQDDGFPRKPDPQGMLAAIQRFGLDPDQALAIGDRDLDLQAAQAAGVAYLCAYGPGPFSLEADFVVRDFDDLLVLLTNQREV
jgi:phosphoglycolate phosphatase-like HAD superfamily hydrolase